MIAPLVAFVLAQAAVITDPTTASRKAKVTGTAGGALQVECVGGTCTGGGGASSGGGTVDGGDLRAHQGSSNDGGYAWHVDVERIGGAAPGATNPLPARLTDGTSFYKGTTPADTQPVSAASLPLPTGAATEATLSGRLAEATFTARIGTQGQKTMAGSTPVVIASDQSGVPVTGPLTDGQLRATPVPISGTVTANAGTGPWPVTDNGGSLTVDGTVTADRVAVTAAAPVNVTVTTSSTTLLSANASRRGYTCQAKADNAVQVNWREGTTAVTTDPELWPRDSYTKDSGAIHTGAIAGIVSSGTAVVRCWEW